MSIPESHLAQEAIAALVDGELSGGAANRAARHLTGCAQCRMAVAAQREAKDALRYGVDVAVPGDLISRLQAIPFTAAGPGAGLGSLSAGSDGLAASGAGGSWAIPLAPAEAPPRSDGGARWLRRGMTGALAGLGLGVAVLAVNLPTADMPDREPVADAVRYAPTERTDIVPPVVRTFTVGSTTGLPAGGTP
ncbi:MULTISPECIES: anti-sigma factor family protein [unclassified Modestobacter]|uniref:anti-sigma factor family protein n=1 Tax=unclassified Modestobacter TaxID=2643866 RepID=UPI0022AA8CC1|nr:MULTISPECIES: zf-HC2 domain-containing protein [unclassified Modestobacter]